MRRNQFTGAAGLRTARLKAWNSSSVYTWRGLSVKLIVMQDKNRVVIGITTKNRNHNEWKLAG